MARLRTRAQSIEASTPRTLTLGRVVGYFCLHYSIPNSVPGYCFGPANSASNAGLLRVTKPLSARI
ncbi:hypothetical protein, partial [Pantoea sp. ANP04]|uniref:hypothetical protein n=1 Tax=Pantoea sp. ANP04 TaxID=3064896 RepID=UPI0035C5B32C